MPKLQVIDMTGKNSGALEVSDSIFAVKINASLIHRAVIAFLANRRQGTQSALTRAEVAGGGRKPWRQKGTGRARQGSTRSPQWTHGGVAFAPKPRDYSLDMNKKQKRLALCSALSQKVVDGDVIILDSIDFPEIKTKTAAEMLKAIGVENKALVVTDVVNQNFVKSARNIENTKTTIATTLNVYDIVKYDKLVLTKDAVKKIEEVYA